MAEIDEHPPPEMCAKQFLLWMTKYFPESVNEWITAHDIEVHLYPMFVDEGGGTRSFLSFVRGLGKVTRKRSCEYTDPQANAVPGRNTGC